jgi:dephospho-CoA kinase
MLVIAVTGGIGSGKSTVADLFKNKGIPVIDTDLIARQLVQPGTPLLQQIITEFGSEYLDADGHLRRKALGKLIFNDAKARSKLEALMHPAIHGVVTAQLQKLKSPYCLILIPLLAHSRQSYPYDRVLVVDTTAAIRIQRTVHRDQLSPDLVKQIIASQPTREELFAIADDVVENNGDMKALALVVEDLHQRYLELSRETS